MHAPALCSQELSAYLHANDLDSEIFNKAFDNIDVRDGNMDGEVGTFCPLSWLYLPPCPCSYRPMSNAALGFEVDSVTLMNDFTALVIALKQGHSLDEAIEAQASPRHNDSSGAIAVVKGESDPLMDTDSNNPTYGSVEGYVGVHVPLHGTSEGEHEHVVEGANYPGQSEGARPGESGKEHILKF